MNKPTIDDLMKKVDSKYTLAVLAAKRARQITAEIQEDVFEYRQNPVSVALTEIAAGEIQWEKSSVETEKNE